ncbi:hypothetical protein KCU81_g4760, partial [Aureobasidium melanogenum]|uniref:F-box domain-containing protein n=1 Tax=Aureobasidium melanogenum (strain CBS 110374) TaxID=1043003 RepID=A0A074WAF7_AURM1
MPWKQHYQPRLWLLLASTRDTACYTLIGQQPAPPFLRKHRGIRDYDLVGSHSVKRFEINSCPSWLQLDLRPYLSSSITSFTLLGCSHFPRSLLDLVAFCCPKLRNVHLDYLAEDQEQEHFLKFLRRCRHLRELTLSSEDGVSIPKNVLENLASRKQLEYLYAPLNTIPYHSIETMMRENPRLSPFRDARSLFLSMETRAATSVLSAAESLVEIQLDLADSEHDVFQVIGSLHCLETVEISFAMPKRLTIHELQAISGLTRLKDLSIYGPPTELHWDDGRPLLIAEAWTDDLFDSWIASFVHLEKLLLSVRPSSSHWISETRLIGKSCPNLTTLSMDGIHDIGAWRVSPAPLFPALRQLELGRLKPWPFPMSAEENREYAKGLACLIQQHAPLLEELSVGRDELSNAVAEAYKQERLETRCINEVTMFDA